MPKKTNLPPQSIEAELAVLGSLMVDGEAVVRIAEFLSPAHFYKESNGNIYETILELYSDREPIDMVTVTDSLKKKKILKKVGGASYLADLASEVPTSTHIEKHAKIVKDAATRRTVIDSARKIAEMGYDETLETEELLDRAETELFSISKESVRTDFTPIKQALETSFDRIDQLHKQKGALRGVPTGLKSLDEKLSGFQKSNLIIVAGRPSVGKSALSTNIVHYAAVEEQIPIAMFSLEMSTDQLVDRFLWAEADVDAWRLSTGYLEEEDFAKLGRAMGELADAPIFIDDTPGISVMEMRAKARRLQMENDIQMLVVDYLQLIRGRGYESRVQEVSEISLSLKSLARELNIPVVALSQLSRAVEKRGRPKPQLSDLRESGAIEQDADVVLFLYRSDEERRNEINLLIAKHRNGPTGEVPLYFRANRTRFYEMEEEPAGAAG